MTEAPNHNQCAGCGQFDNHPKVHVGDVFGGSNKVDSLHLDCLPFQLAQDLRNDPVLGADHAEAIDAAKAGTHGDALREILAANATKQTVGAVTQTAPNLEA